MCVLFNLNANFMFEPWFAPTFVPVTLVPKLFEDITELYRSKISDITESFKSFVNIVSRFPFHCKLFGMIKGYCL